MSIQPKYSSMITKSLSFTSVPTSHNTSIDTSRASMACIWCHEGEIMLYTLNLHFQHEIYFSALHTAIATTSGFQPFTITMKSAHTSKNRYEILRRKKKYQSVNLKFDHRRRQAWSGQVPHMANSCFPHEKGGGRRKTKGRKGSLNFVQRGRTGATRSKRND